MDIRKQYGGFAEITLSSLLLTCFKKPKQKKF